MAKSKPKQARAWQRMLSGRRLDLLDPTLRWISKSRISPTALHLSPAGMARLKGDYAYSVAEHSLLVEALFARIVPAAEPKWKLAALLHDAPEYVIGDMISPVKNAVGPGYEELDERLTAAIHIRFGMPAKTPPLIKKQIKKADRLSAWLEATQIAGLFSGRIRQTFRKA